MIRLVKYRNADLRVSEGKIRVVATGPLIIYVPTPVNCVMRGGSFLCYGRMGCITSDVVTGMGVTQFLETLQTYPLLTSIAKPMAHVSEPMSS